MADNKSELIIIPTADNSLTLFNPFLKETYHSIHGALQESMHVFIENGLKLNIQKQLDILEVGLGTGLNAALTSIQAEMDHLTVNYNCIEPFPIPDSILNDVAKGYPVAIKKLLLDIGNQPWERKVYLNNHFSLIKHLIGIQTFNTLLSYDIIYYDAFAPDKQPEMWTFKILSKTAKMLKPGGMLCTYCAKGEVKRNLTKAGLIVEPRKGPVGKREMTVARMPEE